MTILSRRLKHGDVINISHVTSKHLIRLVKNNSFDDVKLYDLYLIDRDPLPCVNISSS